MKRVLIIPMNTVSHYYASLGLARTLRQLGYEVLYGGDARFEKTVEDNGFFLLHLSTYLLADNDKLTLDYRHFSTFWKKKAEVPSTTIIYRAFCDELALFRRRINQVQPDYIFLDACLTRYVIPLYDQPGKKIILQLMLPTRQDQQVPPHNSAVIPKGRRSMKRYGAWQWNYQKNIIDAIVKYVCYPNVNPKLLLRRWARERQLPLAKVIRFRKSQIYDEVPSAPELSLTPNEFDFPWKREKPHVHAIGPFIDTSRTLGSEACNFEVLRRDVLESGRFNKVVFCSFGTLPALRGKSDQMIRKIINIFRHRPNVALIIATGSDFSITQESKNTFLFKRVPQVQLLAYCDLMIGHGGLNSVFECLTYRVPMLLIPLSSSWDHPGICARVVYHRVGLMLTLKQSTDSILRTTVDELLTNPLYQKCIAQLSSTITGKNLTAEVSQFMELTAN